MTLTGVWNCQITEFGYNEHCESCERHLCNEFLNFNLIFGFYADDDHNSESRRVGNGLRKTSFSVWSFLIENFVWMSNIFFLISTNTMHKFQSNPMQFWTLKNPLPIAEKTWVFLFTLKFRTQLSSHASIVEEKRSSSILILFVESPDEALEQAHSTQKWRDAKKRECWKIL